MGSNTFHENKIYIQCPLIAHSSPTHRQIIIPIKSGLVRTGRRVLRMSKLIL